ncbi:protein translocase subunit SecF [Stakelama tenebrarum]|uniref:Protein-export membrane protein SecF n=1 Tax=Stakelama tenebrarum TaxID=2711215 RepID=A0A6G6Y335_9SPHN|nr:protein translocase subunit SecF [Sphingosinithalassobacter tenebrarum]QIG79335.1 protein translocase subunit SecF [Sphingosinithalassobacter tenebrarum]
MRPLKLVPENTNIDFLRLRTVFMAVSILLIVASIALVAIRGLNFGVDFAGGQMVRVTFAQPVPINQVRERIDGLGLGESAIQQFGDARDVAIRMPLPEGGAEATDEQGDQLRAFITTTWPGATIGSVDTVSGKVSEELFQKGALALALAMLAIAVYIWIRFEWQFGIGALFSLGHDVALTFGFFAITQLEFNLNIVAAILTIIGYSLNDTIVVYDRVRENLRKYRKMEIVPLLNLSTNETLARTIVTSLTLIIALATLVLVGPEVIFGFSVAMLLGIVIGTYSSIYIANPILIYAKVGPHSFVPPEAGPAGAERVKAKELP